MYIQFNSIQSYIALNIHNYKHAYSKNKEQTSKYMYILILQDLWMQASNDAHVVDPHLVNKYVDLDVLLFTFSMIQHNSGY